jgi:hypothetical protein
MAQIPINNGQTGLVVRNALNDMFTEIYDSISSPLRLNGINSNTQKLIPANTFLQGIYIRATEGAPTLRIGTTPNGQEICPDVQPGDFLSVLVQQYVNGGLSLYFTLSGGRINVRFDAIQKFF